MELAIGFLWSAMSGGGAPSNQVTFRLNGVDVFVTPFFESHEEFQASVNASDVPFATGTNTLEIIRTGVTANTWLAIDYLEATLNATANQDNDNDGLPFSWESLYQLSDEDASDAEQNFDQDLLTNLQEFLAGTNPRDGDSDNDGLADHLEVITDPLNPDSDNDGLLDGEETTSNPSLVDSDNDGASDGWEIQTGFDPSNNTSTPPSFTGAIGINFRSQYQKERGFWSEQTPNGLVPQTHWNHTEVLRFYRVGADESLLSGNTTTIASPSLGTLLDSSGTPVSTSLSFSYDGCWTSSNSGTAPAELLNGFLQSNLTSSASITLTDIPYANYDLYVYFSADYLGPPAAIRLIIIHPLSQKKLEIRSIGYDKIPYTKDDIVR